MSTKHYIYTPKRSIHNKTSILFTVYRMKKNVPYLVGSERINTTAYKGDDAAVYSIISEAENIPMSDCGFYITGDIKIHSVG